MKKIFLVVLASIVSIGIFRAPMVHAAGNIITVNSTADVTSNDGECTLREAITAANSDSASGLAAGECTAGNGADTIEFNITHTSGGDTFTNNGHTGYIISPNGSSLPNINDSVTIDGYSQPGSSPNTAPSPQPLNGTLLIEIDGTNAGSGASTFGFNSGVSNVVIQGIVMDDFDNGGVSGGGTDAVKLLGNYIGIDPTGMIAKPNNQTGVYFGNNMQIGGLNPSDRNIISGNAGGGGTPSNGAGNWVFQGNYLGIGADGKTQIPNSQPYGAGGISVDQSAHGLIGGTTTAATNVISGNNSAGLIPDDSSNLTIEGNLIGPDWQGNPIPNTNQKGGIQLAPATNNLNNILIRNNTIAFNHGPGVWAIEYHFTDSGNVHSVSNAAILGNSIYGNIPISWGGGFLPADGLGIDLTKIFIDLNTFVLSSTPGFGTSINDPGDVDSGPNDFLNHPVISSFKQTGTTAKATFDLDTAGSLTGQYRVEFFATDNNSAGQGKTYLGYANVTAGSAKTATISLPAGTNLTGQYITATDTQITGGASNDGFGATSEFSDPVTAIVSAVGVPNTGLHKEPIQTYAIFTILLSGLSALVYALGRFKFKLNSK